ncbi:unnamed protein product [Paramecium pentaurelia]|uniref:Casein kinase II subunit beta n=1 Tax=Paramecium pentaurelia TaxID=43138 RepID=A0A8S1XL31_9CILI|nr:unnamed protein product [Paramecium pentaurelia]
MSRESSISEGGGWVQWFCAMEDHQFLCEVDDEFIRDNFNLYGLKSKFNFYNEALDLILSSETPDDEDLEDERFLEVYQEATDLYGLIHARFIITAKGLGMMKDKYLGSKFGACPRVLCERQNVLPVGMSEELRTSRVKVFCPRCEEVYIPKKKCPDVDGAYFGCSFPSIFLMNFIQEIQIPANNQTYVPRVFGFRIHKKKGSRYQDTQQKATEITHYSEEQLKKLRGKNDQQGKEDYVQK